MRYFTVLFFAVLFTAIALSGQTQTDDPYELKLVQADLRRISSGSEVDMPGVAKNVQRLGDRISVALLKILDERDLTDLRSVKAFLPLIRQAFSYPSIISIDADKNPKVTLFFLGYLQRNVSDRLVRRQIQETIAFVKQKTSS